ncbi:MAG: hypothetical protein QXG00_05755 [Candidatus Woesearchaeota archaeon]
MSRKKVNNFEFLDSLTSEELKNLSNFIMESIKIKNEIKEKQEILRDYLKAYCEEKDYERSVLTKLINLSFKIVRDSDPKLIEREMKILQILSSIQDNN